MFIWIVFHKVSFFLLWKIPWWNSKDQSHTSLEVILDEASTFSVCSVLVNPKMISWPLLHVNLILMKQFFKARKCCNFFVNSFIRSWKTEYLFGLCFELLGKKTKPQMFGGWNSAKYSGMVDQVLIFFHHFLLANTGCHKNLQVVSETELKTQLVWSNFFSQWSELVSFVKYKTKELVLISQTQVFW